MSEEVPSQDRHRAYPASLDARRVVDRCQDCHGAIVWYVPEGGRSLSLGLVRPRFVRCAECTATAFHRMRHETLRSRSRAKFWRKPDPSPGLH